MTWISHVDVSKFENSDRLISWQVHNKLERASDKLSFISSDFNLLLYIKSVHKRLPFVENLIYFLLASKQMQIIW